MDALSQSALLVSLISFALGFSVLSRNVRNILFLSFATLTTLISVWSMSFFLENIFGGFGFYRLHLFFNVLLAPAALTLIRVMVRVQDHFSRRLLDLSVVLAVCLSFSLFFHLEELPFVHPLIYFSPALVVVQTLHLMWLDRQSKLGLLVQPKVPIVGIGKRNLIYMGALVVLASSVMDHVPWMAKGFPVFGNLALTAYLFFLSQAITQQRFLNISALFSRFIVLLVVAFTLTAVYSLLVAWVENSPGLFFLNSFIASFLLLMLLDPLRTAVRYFTQQLLTQKHRRLQQILEEAERNLTGIVDLGTLFQALLGTVELTLQPEWAALFVLRSDGTKYRRMRVIGKEPDADLANPILREILVHHPLLQYCEEHAQKGEFPILLDQILENEIDRSASRVQREEYGRLVQGLKALGSNLLMPLVDSHKVLGFVALKIPHPPEPWGNNWGLLPIIYTYFQHVAQTMHSMEVYVRQREKERLATLGEMAAGLAHEIRNPLGAIKGAAQFLDPSEDRPESRFLRVIIEEVDRLNRVVTQFLDYSKPPTLDFKPVDVSKLTEKTLELLKPEIENKENPIQVEFYPSRTAVVILASAEQIRQVLINLLQNAHKALEGKTSGVIRVSVGSEGEFSQNDVVIVIEDNGKGIKKEHLEKLFIPFFTTSPSGTGLGLSISHKIVEAHRGRIEVTSEEGRFTRFSVLLPLFKE